MAERWVRYHGESMLETFAPGDLLRVRTLDGRAPSVGDVVVFRSGTGQRLVHRVTGVRQDGWLETRGDARPAPDSEAVGPDALEGIVVGVLGRGGEREVAGSPRRSRSAATPPRAWRRAGGRVYRWLAARPTLRRLLRLVLRPRLRTLRYQRAGRSVVQVMHRGRVVAWLYPETGRMRSRPLYALLVDPPSREEGQGEPPRSD
jgi:hypothetical protein